MQTTKDARTFHDSGRVLGEKPRTRVLKVFSVIHQLPGMVLKMLVSEPAGETA